MSSAGGSLRRIAISFGGNIAPLVDVGAVVVALVTLDVGRDPLVETK